MDAVVVRVRGNYEQYVLARSEDEAALGLYVRIPQTLVAEDQSFMHAGCFMRQDLEAMSLLYELEQKVAAVNAPKSDEIILEEFDAD